MNFYKHHLGDYASATAHLSWDEDMAYSRLMRVYYRDEKPLPLEPRQVYRLTRAQSKVQREAIDTVLEEFFEKQEDGWHNKRCDEEVAQAQAQAEINRKIAANRPPNRPRAVNGSFNGSHHEPSTNGPPLQTPDSNIQNPDKPSPTPPSQGGASRQPRAEARAEKDEAVAAWIALLASQGAKRDARVQAAIDAVGGWSRIAQREQGMDANIVRKAFCDAYRAMGQIQQQGAA